MVRNRLAEEPGVVDADDVREAPQRKLAFVTDKEKADLSGVTTEQIAATLRAVLAGDEVGLERSPTERNPLRIELRAPVAKRASPEDLARIEVKGSGGQLVPLAEVGEWRTARVDQMIYHKNTRRVAYVFAKTSGRPPADVVVDVLADKKPRPVVAPTNAANGPDSTGATTGRGFMPPRPLAERTFLSNGGGIGWGLPAGFTVDFAGEGEWKITLDVFRDLGLAFAAAMIGAAPIIIDPIFSGLAWSLIFGLFASTIFTLFVIPVVYWLLYANKPGHGLPPSAMEREEVAELVVA